jgi:plastocyanin
MRVLAGFTTVLVLAFATACGGGGSAATQAPGSTPGGVPVPTAKAGATTANGEAAVTCGPSETSADTVISITGTHDVSSPDATVAVGDSVTFSNDGSANHKLKFTIGPDCGFSLIGKSVTAKFMAAGQYAWFDQLYPTFLKGTITVQ